MILDQYHDTDSAPIGYMPKPYAREPINLQQKAIRLANEQRELHRQAKALQLNDRRRAVIETRMSLVNAELKFTLSKIT